MKKIVLLLTALVATGAHGHSAMSEKTGTQVAATISTTWRDEGPSLQNGVWQIPGVLMGGEAFPVEEGMALDEARITLQHYAAAGSYGMLQISSHDNGNEAEVHHAFAGYRLQWQPVAIHLEAGRMAALITPSNGEHASDRLFSEAPLALDAFLGRQLNDEGFRTYLQWQGWQLGAEHWRGSAFPATAGNDGGSYDLYLQHRGALAKLDWHAGIWSLQADASNRTDTRYDSGHRHGTTTVTLPEHWFDGSTDVSGAFARLQWNTTPDTTFMLAAEWLAQKNDGHLRDATRIAAISSDNHGGWIETSARFKQHELGVRREQLALDNTITGAAAAALANLSGVYNEHDPTRTTLIYRWQFAPGFSLRVEYTEDDSNVDDTQRVAVGLIWKETLWSNR